MMNKRPEFFHIINEICKEMRVKFDTDFERTNISQQMFTWQSIVPDPEDEQKDPLAKPTRLRNSNKMSEESDSDCGFDFRCDKGFRIGLLMINIEDKRGNSKRMRIVQIAARSDGEETILRTNLNWYDYLRPSVWRLFSFMKHARRVRVRNSSLLIEKHLAKIIPDRIDNILLGGHDAKN